MICKKCGVKFSDGLFCPECGTRAIPVGVSEGAEQEEWDSISESLAEEGYDTKKYGPQGQLEEQKITGKDYLGAGSKRLFESKILIFEQGISIEENAVLEFRNCKLVIERETAIWIKGKNVSIDFDNCYFEGEKGIVNKSGYDDIKLEFRNCALIYQVSTGTLVEACGTVYFENCFIKSPCICELQPVDSFSMESKLEFRNCIVIEGNDRQPYYSKRSLVYASKAVVEFRNCFVRCSKRLVDWKRGYIGYKSGDIKVLIENTYFDSNSYTFFYIISC